MRDGTVKALSALHRAVFRVTRGRLGGRLPSVDGSMLLLTTTGRRSGRLHTVPLLYLRDGSDLAVIASYGGRNHHPDWYLNLVADPRGEVEIGGGRCEVAAAPVVGPDRQRLWRDAVAAYPGYEQYRARTDREIPIVRLRRVE